LDAGVGSRLSDSPQYARLWGTPELSRLFDDAGRLGSWMQILAALARSQARLGMIPADAADAISEHVDPSELDMDYLSAETRRTSHSTLGFIHAWQRILPESARQFVYYGATVQDVTDTWFALVMREVGAIAYRDLHAIEANLLTLAAVHRDTVMLGRTHGQPGSPITFGYKAAVWADEIRRHIERLVEGRTRREVGELAGAVGVLGFFGDDGIRLRTEFCAELRLHVPTISWIAARDRIAEFASLLAMVCTTLARIGTEVYELARPEIGELREAVAPGTVGSITMPHKRNPESSEHLDTLARLARAQAGVLLEAMGGSHERDGRSWKTEWLALPEVCLLAGAALGMARTLTATLEVDAAAMQSNLHGFTGSVSEQLLAGLSRAIGKHRAQEALQQLTTEGRSDDLAAGLVSAGIATSDDVSRWLAASPITGARQMVDDVLARAQATRTAGESWCR
jgi:adenylosuccinate lyase